MTAIDGDKDDDIARHFSSETTRKRGRGRKDSEEKLEDEQLRWNIIKALRHKDERRFSEMLRKAGLQDGDERWTNAWKIYRSYWVQS